MITRQEKHSRCEPPADFHKIALATFKGDRNLRLVVHEPHRFACHHRLSQPEFFTLITIDCFAGRSVQAKRNLYTEIVQRLGQYGIPSDHITITVRDIPAEDWGIRGGQAACDVDLGFEVNV